MEQVRNKAISPVELTQAFLDRIEAINPKLNAYVTTHPEKSLAWAKEAEDAVQRGDDLGPLHGLPVNIKDLTCTEGIRTIRGSNVYANDLPDHDAPIVTRLKNAGAISLGKTNTPEFGWLAITDNDVFGQTTLGTSSTRPPAPVAVQVQLARQDSVQFRWVRTAVVPFGIRHRFADSLASNPPKA